MTNPKDIPNPLSGEEPTLPAARHLRAVRAQQGITVTSSGMIVASGREAVDLVALCSLICCLELETKGLRMSRGQSAYSIAKKRFGFKGNKASVLKQLRAWKEENYPTREQLDKAVSRN